MGYTAACLNELVNMNINVYVVGWDKKKLVKYNFANSESFEFRGRSSFETSYALLKWVQQKEPNVIYVSGRMDKAYLYVAKYFKKRCTPVISGFDNQWHGTIKDYIKALFSRPLFHQYFSHLWVAGYDQFNYGIRLGFNKERILLNVYSCDYQKFQKVFKRRSAKNFLSSRTLFFVGRFADVKNLDFLLRVYSSLTIEERNGWKLVLIGEGPLKKELSENYGHDEDVEFQSFKGPNELIADTVNYGAFILPSKKEAWGVVLQEFAVAGFPILASSACGGAKFFVKEGINGFTFDPLSSDDLRTNLKKLFNLKTSALVSMKENSHRLGSIITPRDWASTLVNLKGEF